ncbi:hypothetical protein, partial [Akkermansia sp.]|uniref:hypothetical protein n=1 Tax=Akkermansia sp. TaxID=1872421 RepID=UPI003AF77A06
IKNEIDPGVQQAFLYAGFFHVIYSINLILSREKLKISVLLITGLFIQPAIYQRHIAAIRVRKAVPI